MNLSTGSLAGKIGKWVLGILLLLVIGFDWGFVPWFMTGVATTFRFHFADPNDKKTPHDYGMAYQEVEFQSSDGIDLKGWYLPAHDRLHARGTIVYAHGRNRSRVEMLPMAQFAHGLGYNGLVFDLRHHGESGGSMSSVGYWERRDVEAAVRYALEQQKSPRPVVAWGISMGAAAALGAAADSPQIDAVISDSSFLSFKDTVLHHFYLFRGFVWWLRPLPAFPVVNEVIAWSAHRAHFAVADFDLEKAVRQISARPILFIGVEGDRRMPPDIARKLYGDSTSPGKQLVILPGEKHGEGFNSGKQQYQEAVTKFLAALHG